MNFKQKLGYMFIGCLFTIAGYILASLGGNTTHAQQNEQVIDKIVCRELEVVNKEGKRIILMDPFFEGGAVWIFNKEGMNIASIRADSVDGGGVMEVYNAAGKSGVRIGAGIHNGNGGVEVYNAAGKPSVDIVADGKGGIMGVYNAAGKIVAGMTGKDTGGVMEVYNTLGKVVVDIGATDNGEGHIQTYKGGWRTH